jgi:hypothetical protein
MTEQYLQILPTPETTWSSPPDVTPRFTAVDLAKRTQALTARIAELEAELVWYRSSFGHIDDQEIQRIISNL